MNKVLGIFITAVLMSSCSEAQVHTEKKENSSIVTAQETNQVINKVVSAKEFKTLLEKENIQIIDVRTPGEFAEGYIPNAVNIDYFGSDFKSEIAKLDKSKTTLIYCKSGGRSGKAGKMMKKLGFKEVYDLEGGFSRWPFK